MRHKCTAYGKAVDGSFIELDPETALSLPDDQVWVSPSQIMPLVIQERARKAKRAQKARERRAAAKKARTDAERKNA